MSRMQEEHVAIIKEKLLKRLPDCKLTPDDVKEIAEKTGVIGAMILKWANHFRSHHAVADREAALRTSEKVC
jgi:hypothetical protein